MTPILIVEQIEPCLFFWMGRLGFEKVAEVYEGDHLGFVMLSQGSVQIMYQTFESIEKDMPNTLKYIKKGQALSTIYVKVSNIEWIEKHLDGVEIVNPKRNSFYGATEICVREPAGHLITFAAFKDVEASESDY
ncbi:MAG: hypothetical protein KDD46_03970 [Bdellovibrionales bacterium]|nr:hypothetical protein [Bdellovibrionales bacterium]